MCTHVQQSWGVLVDREVQILLDPWLLIFITEKNITGSFLSKLRLRIEAFQNEYEISAQFSLPHFHCQTVCQLQDQLVQW